MKESIRSLLNFRGFILTSVKRDFQVRFQSSMLGSAWLIIQPIAMILVYTLVFSKIMGAKLPGNIGFFSYSIYLCTGLLTWGLFFEIVSRNKNLFIENANLIKKVSFPKLCLPIIVTISSLISFFIIFTIFVIFMILTKNFPGINFLYIFPILLLQLLFSFGVGLMFSVINVYFRDVGQLLDIGLQFLFWGTPIVYTLSITPEWVQYLLAFNPLAIFIGTYQNIMLTNTPPEMSNVIIMFSFTCFFLFFGSFIFARRSGSMVDEL